MTSVAAGPSGLDLLVVFFPDRVDLCSTWWVGVPDGIGAVDLGRWDPYLARIGSTVASVLLRRDWRERQAFTDFVGPSEVQD